MSLNNSNINNLSSENNKISSFTSNNQYLNKTKYLLNNFNSSVNNRDITLTNLNNNLKKSNLLVIIEVIIFQ